MTLLRPRENSWARCDRPATLRWTALCGVLAVLTISPALADTIPEGDLTIKLEPVAAGLTAPVVVKNAEDGSGRLFVVQARTRGLAATARPLCAGPPCAACWRS